MCPSSLVHSLVWSWQGAEMSQQRSDCNVTNWICDGTTVAAPIRKSTEAVICHTGHLNILNKKLVAHD